MNTRPNRRLFPDFQALHPHNVSAFSWRLDDAEIAAVARKAIPPAKIAVEPVTSNPGAGDWYLPANP